MYINARGNNGLPALEHNGSVNQDLRNAERTLLADGYRNFRFLGIGNMRFVVSTLTPEKEQRALKISNFEFEYADTPALVLPPENHFAILNSRLFAETHQLADTTCTDADLAAVMMLLGHENQFIWDDVKPENIGRVNGKLRIIDNERFSHSLHADSPYPDIRTANYTQAAEILCPELKGSWSALTHPNFLLLRKGTVSQRALQRFAAQEGLGFFTSPAPFNKPAFHALFDPAQEREGAAIAEALHVSAAPLPIRPRAVAPTFKREFFY